MQQSNEKQCRIFCDKCTINCFGISSCQYTTIDASICNNLEINGMSISSLDNAIIHAPKHGNLTINTYPSTRDSNVEKILYDTNTDNYKNKNKSPVVETFSNSIMYGNSANSVNILCDHGIKCSSNTLFTQSVSSLNIRSHHGEFSHNIIYCPNEIFLCNIELDYTISYNNTYHCINQVKTVSFAILYLLHNIKMHLFCWMCVADEFEMQNVHVCVCYCNL